MKLNDWLKMIESALKMIESHLIIDLYKKKKKNVFFIRQSSYLIDLWNFLFNFYFIYYIYSSSFSLWKTNFTSKKLVHSHNQMQSIATGLGF